MQAVTSRATNLGELLKQLGGIPLERVRMRPPPGTATERDVLEVDAHENRFCELVDGVLVEKGMGYWESVVAYAIGRILSEFVDAHDLGVVSGEGGMLKLAPGLVRIPDVGFVSTDRISEISQKVSIPPVAPDLAVEVLSETNTKKEMARKRREYFEAGTQLVWEVDLNSRTISVYTDVDEVEVLREGQKLTGADVLPGFSMPVAAAFSKLDTLRKSKKRK